MNYLSNKLTKKEMCISVLLYVVMDILISFLFYDSGIAFVILLPFYTIFFKYYKNQCKKKKIEELKEQFCEMISSISTSISAGLSLENSFRESKLEVIKLYGENSAIVKELSEIISKLDMNKPVEESLIEFAEKTNIEEIKDFSVIVKEAKKYGGNIRDIISRTVSFMIQKKEAEKEIRILLNAKLLEQKVMCAVPFFIIGYLRISSGDFMDVLYHNVAGEIVMTVCLTIYIISILLSLKIIDIEI